MKVNEKVTLGSWDGITTAAPMVTRSVAGTGGGVRRPGEGQALTDSRVRHAAALDDEEEGHDVAELPQMVRHSENGNNMKEGGPVTTS
jgi:hypothetical protein